jgi:ATP-dependent Zn protease
MDGFDSTHNGVIVVAATNRPEILDPALLRPGRFDRHVTVDKPTLQGRIDILKVHAKKTKLGPDVNLDLVAQRTPGFAGADLANIVNEAALLTARKGKGHISMDDFEKAIDRVIAGVEKKGQVMSPQEKERNRLPRSRPPVVAMNLKMPIRSQSNHHPLLVSGPWVSPCNSPWKTVTFTHARNWWTS